MDDKTLVLAKGLITPRYVDVAMDALGAHRSALASLVAQRRLPDAGFHPALIEALLAQLALMDANNYHGHAGAGEREGRVYSQTVLQRHRFMSHGVGRSGDLLADQPKAPGSSLMKALANVLCRDALRQAGLGNTGSAIVFPTATGLALALVLQAARAQRPPGARYVVMPRIDQKTCVKCIAAAGLVPVVVQLRRCAAPAAASAPPAHVDPAAAASAAAPPQPAAAGSGLDLFVESHVDDVRAAVEALPGGAAAVVCLLSVTSCFAPRLPDDPLAMGRLAAALGVPHVVNNAYGVQSPAVARRLDAALGAHAAAVAKADTEHRRAAAAAAKAADGTAAADAPAVPLPAPALDCRVDAFVQSGDKNFLVPVGGSVVAGPLAKAGLPEATAALYPGRAGASATFDLFVTLLEMGRDGWRRLREERLTRLAVCHSRLAAFAAARGETLLQHPRNDISFAVTLTYLAAATAGKKTPAGLGAELFRSAVSGARVVVPDRANVTKIAGAKVGSSFGTHHDESPQPLLVMACGIGMTAHDVDVTFARLEAAYPVPRTGLAARVRSPDRRAAGPS